MAKLLFLAGSARKDSINKKLAQAAAQTAKTLGAEATFIDLADYEMPLYNQDSEAANGLPESVKALKKVFQEHDGVFIASPEYNGGFSALLKNTMDWVSRKETPEEGFLSAYQGKVFALGCASPGAAGGVRGLMLLRGMITNMGFMTVPAQATIGGCSADSFTTEGLLQNEDQSNLLKNVVTKLIDVTNALNK